MSDQYDHKAIEEKWQKKWAEDGLYSTSDAVTGKKNHYTLVEFPYPSGDLHAGHWYAFAVPDIYARAKRMQGYNSLYPIGFDAFGLPAENAAIKNGVDPREWTETNIEHMRDQLKRMGNMFDWGREIRACDPAMYKWTQWLFIQLFKKELAYRKKAFVNWCPKDQTVLANEQVIQGKCERCDSEVEQKDLEQWFLKITEYADRLIDDLEELEWPHAIKESQKNWIGRSEGAEIDFEVAEGKEKITVFTTRPDTLFGATYLVLAPEHPLLDVMIYHNKEEVTEYQKKASGRTDIERLSEGKEKTGVRLDGIMAINPATKEEVPIFVADYVLGQYGTGAIMAVPAHDERDFEFAKKFNLPIKRVVEPKFVGTTGDGAVRKGLDFVKRNAVCVIIRNPKDDTYLCNVWKTHNMCGLLTGGIEDGEDKEEAAVREIREETGYKNVRLASDPELVINTLFYHRQKEVNRWARFHYLFFDLENEEREMPDKGELEKHEFVWKKKEDMKDFFTVFEGEFITDVLDNPDYIFNGDGVLGNSGKFDGMESQEAKKKITEFVGGRMTKTYKQRDWLISRQRYWGTPIPVVYDPEGNAHAVPDEHLPWELPTDVDFTPTGKAPLATSKELVERTEKLFGKGWKPEVDTMDTFMDSSWYFLRYLDPKNTEEFASKEKQKQWMPVNQYSGGAEHTTMHILYSRFFYKALYDLGLVTESEPYQCRMNRSLILAEDGRKMSKRWGNAVNPDEHVKKVGADSVKTYLAFIGPYNEVNSYPWSTNGLIGVRRFLERAWALSSKVDSEASSSLHEVIRHQTIKKVEQEIASMKFNTGVSALMIYVNELQKESAVSIDDYKTLLLLLAPFAPHMAEELWERLGNTTSIHLEAWPEYDADKIVAETVTIGVQVNGKVRGDIEVSLSASQEEAVALARTHEGVQKHLTTEPKKVIYIPGKILSFVV